MSMRIPNAGRGRFHTKSDLGFGFRQYTPFEFFRKRLVIQEQPRIVELVIESPLQVPH
jgi:hypothetical protein